MGVKGVKGPLGVVCKIFYFCKFKLPGVFSMAISPGLIGTIFAMYQ
jgi:hypothetical protein